MASIEYPIAMDAIGTIKAHNVSPATWDGQQKRSVEGVPLWDVTVSCDLGRFTVRVPSTTVPQFATRSEVQIADLAIVGWGRTAPYFSARAIQAVATKASA